jgi:beta-N-acetylhexosaminidase
LPATSRASNRCAALTDSLRDSVGRADAPVLIDQEGGRVQRFKPPLVPQYPSGADLGALYGAPILKPGCGLPGSCRGCMPSIFGHLGITVNCLPVLDVPSPGGHEVIGSRAYGDHTGNRGGDGGLHCDGLKAGGMLPVIKHIPGSRPCRVQTRISSCRVSMRLAGGTVRSAISCRSRRLPAKRWQ